MVSPLSSRDAMARPSPRPEPVTKATCPARLAELTRAHSFMTNSPWPGAAFEPPLATMPAPKLIHFQAASQMQAAAGLISTLTRAG